MTLVSHWEGEPVPVLGRLWGAPLLEVHDRIGSTNDRLRALAREGAEPFTVVLADEQTAGRGRGGRRWHSPPRAGLWMSVLLPGPAGGPHVPLLVGLAAARALESAAAPLAVAIEWPNDLVVGARKLGGVLCEALGAQVVAGVGINVRTPDGGFPPEVAGRAGSVEDAGGGTLARAALAGALLAELRRTGAGARAPLSGVDLEELRARDALRDREVWTEQEGPGRARGIAEDGALVLERPDASRVSVVAGSVRPR